MKILIINTLAIDFNGVTDCIFQYLQAMNRSNIEVSILSTMKNNSVMIKKFEQLGCNMEYLEIRKEKTISYILKLAKLVRKEKFDIVHVHGNSATMAFDLMGALLGGCKVRIAHSHNTTCMHLKADKLLRPLFYKLYTKGFACGREAGKWLFPEREFTVIPNGRNLSKLKFNQSKRNKIREEMNLNDKFVIGNVGRFNEQKNHKFLLAVFAEVRKVRKDAKLVLMGDGALMQQTQDLAKQLNIYNDVIFMGSVSNVPELLNGMDLMVLPSLFEGLPLVVLEWQASGLPCFLSDTITNECVINEDVIRLPLNAGEKKWSEEILKQEVKNRSETRDADIKRVQEAGYDIIENAATLREIYMELYRAKNR